MSSEPKPLAPPDDPALCQECIVTRSFGQGQCAYHRLQVAILEAHGEHCGCSSCAWKKILDEVTR